MNKKDVASKAFTLTLLSAAVLIAISYIADSLFLTSPFAGVTFSLLSTVIAAVVVWIIVKSFNIAPRAARLTLVSFVAVGVLGMFLATLSPTGKSIGVVILFFISYYLQLRGLTKSKA